MVVEGNPEPEHTLSYGAARANILKLENRCMGNRTVGPKPTHKSINRLLLCDLREEQPDVRARCLGDDDAGA
jgi:hypothetical protein